jgi:hypothetical protein
MSIIIPEFHFFQVEGEFFLGDAVEFYDSFLGEAPESLYPIDIDLAGGKELFVVDFDVAVSTEHEAVVAFEFISIDDTAPANSFHREVAQGVCCDIVDYLDFDHPLALQDTENRYFIVCSSAPFALSSPPETGFVHLNFSTEQRCPLRGSGNDSFPDYRDRLKDRWITETNLGSDLACRQLKLKELYDPQPVPTGYLNGIEPASRKVMECVSTALTTKPSTTDSIDLMASTSIAETTVVFPTRLCQKSPGSIFSLYKELE